MVGSTCKPGACLVPIWGRPRTWTSASENPVGALLLVTMALLTTEPGEFFHLCQGLLPGYSGMKWVSYRILFELSGSKAAANNHFSSIVGCCIVATTRTTNGTPVLHSFIYWDVGEPTRHPCSTTGMLQDNHLLQLGVTWDIYSRELLCHREEVLSVMRIVFSESVVFHLVFWVSSFVVFVWFVFVFGVCFVSTLEDTWLFAFHLFSNNVRIADRPQDVLMTVRASSVHGMS